MYQTESEYKKAQLDAVPRFEAGQMLSYDNYLKTVTLLQDILDVEMPSKLGKKDCFRTAWVSGGVEGGNCWGGEANDPVYPDKERSLDMLVDTLEALDVSFRQANAILALVETGTEEERGYYGNYEVYSWKAVPFDVVYDKLVEFGYADPRPEAAPAP